MGKNLDQYIDFVNILRNRDTHEEQTNEDQLDELQYDYSDIDYKLADYKHYLKNKAIEEKTLDYVNELESEGDTKAGLIGGLAGASILGGAGFALDKVVNAPFIGTGIGAVLGGIGGYGAAKSLYKHTSSLDKYKQARQKAIEEIARLTPKNKKQNRVLEKAVQEYSTDIMNKQWSNKGIENKYLQEYLRYR